MPKSFANVRRSVRDFWHRIKKRRIESQIREIEEDTAIFEREVNTVKHDLENILPHRGRNHIMTRIEQIGTSTGSKARKSLINGLNTWEIPYATRFAIVQKWAKYIAALRNLKILQAEKTRLEQKLEK